MSLDSVNVALQMGLLYAIPALAVTVAFRVVGFPDLTPDGSFVLGAAIGAVLVLKGWPSWLGLTMGVMGGAGAGVLTAVLHTRLHISKLLASILVMTMLYSISLRAMTTSNLSLLKAPSLMARLSSDPHGVLPVITISAIVTFLAGLVWLLLKTRLGLLLRAVGDSDSALEQKGFHREALYLIGLAVANALAGLGGVLISQYQGFVDVSMGAGLVIVCLASVIIGETVLRPENVASLLAAPIVGMIVYQFVIAVSLQLGLSAADLKIATAIITLSFVAIDRLRAQVNQRSRQIGNRNI